MRKSSITLKSLTLLFTIALGGHAAASGSVEKIPHLYQLTKDGVTSYVFGTLHMGVSIQDFSPKLLRHLEQTQVMLGEQTLDFYLQSLDVKASYKKAYENRFKTDCTKELNSSDPLEASILYLIKRGVPGSHAGCDSRELPSRNLIAFAPWIFSKEPKGALDAEIAKRLSESGRKVIALETESELAESRRLQQEQLNYTTELLQSFQPAQSKTQIPEKTLSPSEIEDLIGRGQNTIAHYLSGSAEEAYDYDESDHSLLLRNRAWVKKINSEYSQVPFSVVVGYRHLYGQSGILELLRRRGFSVKRVDDQKPYQSNNEFLHIAASKEEIHRAQCFKDYPIEQMDLDVYLNKMKNQAPQKSAVGGLVFENDSNFAVAAYTLLTSHWNYKLKPIMDIDFWNDLEVRACTTVLCASQKIFGKAKGKLYLSFLMKTGLNLSHLGYDRLKPPLFNGETTPSLKNVNAFKALFTPKEWTLTELQPFLNGVLNLPEFLFPLPYARLVQTRFDHWRGSGVHSDATITMFPAIHDLDREYKEYTTVHEIGHLVGSAYGVDYDKEWMGLSWDIDHQKNTARPRSPELFVSPYARTDFFEDFAESFAAYRLNPAKLKKASPGKYRYLKEKIFRGHEYNENDPCPPSLGEFFSAGQ